MNDERLIDQIVNYATLVLLEEADDRFGVDGMPTREEMIALVAETAKVVNKHLLGFGGWELPVRRYLMAIMDYSHEVRRSQQGVPRLLKYAEVKFALDVQEAFGDGAERSELVELAQEVGLEIGTWWGVPAVGCRIAHYLCGLIEASASEISDEWEDYKH